jgi:hypothetical protein
MMVHFTEDERQRSLLEGRLRAERLMARAARTEQAEERARELGEKLEQEALAKQEEVKARLLAEQARQEEARARLLAEQARQELERQLEELRASIRRGTT